MDTIALQSVRWRAVGLFVAVAMGAAFALDAVCALTGGLGTPLSYALLAVRMFSPALASWVVCRFVTGEPWLRAVGLRRPAPGGRGRVLTSALIGAALVVAVSAACLAVAVAAGWMRPDWTLPGLMARISALNTNSSKPLPPAGVLLALLPIESLVAGCTINAAVALGEETGWRGWLLSALAPLGATRAVLLTGVVWGLWHAPLIAMGYEYNNQIPPLPGIALFTVSCVAFGCVLAWLRMRSGSVLPAAVAHGTLNAYGTMPLVLVAVGDSWNPVTSSIVGIPAIVMFAVVAVALLGGHRIVVRAGED